MPDPTLPTEGLPTEPTSGESLAPPNPTQAMPARIGRYAILRLIGEGGMGAVYEARQDAPDRVVALKVIRAGYLSPKLLRRFEHESLILGRLHHPGIAQVYEAGTVEDEHGRATPFFAMELVRGVDLTTYAGTRDLSTRQRLDLVARICDAVDHAHAKGVIHRDLKPSNILIDESGAPKILDFGVARATDSDIAQTTMHTDVGQLIGTVPYMSPEQVAGDPEALDTRSDVYALGVIAYELLAGRLPYDLERRMIHEAVRVIREVEPSRLSLADRTLRGDVETIIAKALEKEPARRYASAEAFASDIRRYLHDEPIAARPASTWYQLSKFARRNRALVAGVVAAFVILIAGIAATSWQAVAATRARDEAQNNLARAEQAESDAQARADELQQVAEFQSEMLSQIDTTAAGVELMEDVRARFDAALEADGVAPEERAVQSDTLRSLLERVNATDTAAATIDRTILTPAVRAIDERFADQPIVDAQLRQALADLYSSIGLFDEASPLQEAALATRRKVLGEDHPDTIMSIANSGYLLLAQGRLTEAESCFGEALEKSRRILGDEDPETLAAINNMGALLVRQGRLAEAEPYFREDLDKCRRVLGEDHPDTLGSLSNMGFLLHAEGKFDEAEPYWREALEKRRRVLGEDDPDTLFSMNNLGSLLQAQGKLGEAESILREALERRRRVLGEDHPDTLQALNELGFLLQAQGRRPEAEALFREALERRRRVLGDDHPDTLISINNLGALMQAQGRLGEAETYFREALEKSRRVLGENHPDTLTSLNNMGALLQDHGRLDEAEQCYLEASERSARVLGERHPLTLTYRINLGRVAQLRGKHQEAIDLLAPAELAARAAFEGDNVRRVAILLTALGRARVGLGYDAGRFALAEANLVEADAVFVDAHARTQDARGCVQGLVDLYTAWNTADPGKGYDAKADEWRARLDAAPTESPSSPN